MLRLTINLGNLLVIGESEVEILKVRNGCVEVGVTAPKSIPVSRKNGKKNVRQSRIQAGEADIEDLGRRPGLSSQ